MPGTVGGRSAGPWRAGPATGKRLAKTRRARRGAGSAGVCAGAEPAAGSAEGGGLEAAPARQAPGGAPRVRASRALGRAVLDVEPRCEPRGAAGPLARSSRPSNLNHAGSQPGPAGGP